jgi:hypothetical protein
MLFCRYKDSGTHVLRALDEIVVMLEDHILKAQASDVQVMCTVCSYVYNVRGGRFMFRKIFYQ